MTGSVAVVIVNYGTSDLVLRSVESVLELDQVDHFFLQRNARNRLSEIIQTRRDARVVVVIYRRGIDGAGHVGDKGPVIIVKGRRTACHRHHQLPRELVRLCFY